MSDSFGALSAGGMVSDAIFIQSWGEHMRRMQEQNGLADQNGSLQAQLAYSLTSYNHLVEQYNKLSRSFIVATREADGEIADLKKRLAAVERERDYANAEADRVRFAAHNGIRLADPL